MLRVRFFPIASPLSKVRAPIVYLFNAYWSFLSLIQTLKRKIPLVMQSEKYDFISEYHTEISSSNPIQPILFEDILIFFYIRTKYRIAKS